ncbi:speriolin-like protein [Paralichthys olivaceus]|uniref:speriolin-like protein n=1 Tax=Paralichthys olivaceus TaxID=8255 RepID=UPI003751541E
MDMEQTITVLQSQNEQLGQENEQLRFLFTVVRENSELKSRLQLLNNNTLEAPTVCFPSGRKHSTTTLDEKQFSNHLEQTRLQNECRTSSPTHSRSFKQNSAHTDLHESTSQSCQADVELEDKDTILGEIAYQLDRRILSYIFQGSKRHYGFTLQNIPNKIVEVSTNPLTGKVDKGYQLYLTQRYADLMEQLNQLGYKKTLHPQFSEFIVNSYGLLNGKSGEHSAHPVNYNNPETLKKLVMTTAPVRLQENLLLLLKCLCNLAEKDRKPLFLL